MVGGVRNVLRRILCCRITCRSRQQRNRRAALCLDGLRGGAGRCRGHRPQHVHRDDGSNLASAARIPEFVDVDERTYNMSVQMLERFLEKQCVRNSAGKLISLRSGRPVTAVVPVHLYGQMADMDPILELAEQLRAYRG